MTIDQRIERIRAELAGFKKNSFPRRRITLESQLLELITKKLRAEIRADRRR